MSGAASASCQCFLLIGKDADATGGVVSTPTSSAFKHLCASPSLSLAISRRRHHFAHLRHVTFHSTQPNEFGVSHLGDDIRQSCFSTSGRTGNNQRRQPVSLDCATQKFSRREDMFLSDKFIERPWTHTR